MQDMVLVIVLIICAITDIKDHKIYNMVLVPALLFGFIYNIYISGWAGLIQFILGFMLGLGILILPFVLGGMGAGDVKLLAVIGAVKGPLFILYCSLGMGLIGGVMALAILAYKAQLFIKPAIFLSAFWLMLISGFKVITFDFSKEKISLPYGLAIAFGAAGAYWWMG